MDNAADDALITQPRCPHCLREFHVFDVIQMSQGETPCPICGTVPPRFTRLEDYHAALRASWKAGRG